LYVKHIACDFPMLHACCEPVKRDPTYSSCAVQFKVSGRYRPFGISTRQNSPNIFGLDVGIDD